MTGAMPDAINGAEAGSGVLLCELQRQTIVLE